MAYDVAMAVDTKLPPSWLIMVYRVPSEPSRHRVAVWREMKRMGALYLQNCVCLLPALRGMRAELRRISDRVATMSGSSLIIETKKLAEPELSQVLDAFREQSNKEYDEIIEECTTKFHKEIEFERFRQNFTYEEAEEIYSDLEKLKSWLGRVSDRDWFGSGKREEAERHVASCEKAYEEFERECFAASGMDVPGQQAAPPAGRATGTPADGQRPPAVWRHRTRRPTRPARH
jgi:hypothetical protein